jgi:hypothetical protein
MTNTDWEPITAELIAKHSLDWPRGLLTDMQLMRALGTVIKDALREGEKIGIRETADNARKQFRGMNAPSLMPHGS